MFAVVAGRSGAGSHYRSFSSVNCRPFGAAATAGTMIERDAVRPTEGEPPDEGKVVEMESRMRRRC